MVYFSSSIWCREKSQVRLLAHFMFMDVTPQNIVPHDVRGLCVCLAGEGGVGSKAYVGRCSPMDAVWLVPQGPVQNCPIGHLCMNTEWSSSSQHIPCFLEVTLDSVGQWPLVKGPGLWPPAAILSPTLVSSRPRGYSQVLTRRGWELGRTP